ncbi:HNH endonuclease [Mycolicibacterium insubricum]|nr:HNH endonuclease [Mycolicibacterium insubricum]
MSGIQRPCLGCGKLIGSGSRCGPCRPQPKRTAPERGYDHRWRQLSTKQRKASPFCERCGSTQTLECDHIIPLAERPDLALEPLNTRVLCRTCNRSRGNRATDAERKQVLDAITRRKQRLARFYASQQ